MLFLGVTSVQDLREFPVFAQFLDAGVPFVGEEMADGCVAEGDEEGVFVEGLFLDEVSFLEMVFVEGSLEDGDGFGQEIDVPVLQGCERGV